LNRQRSRLDPNGLPKGHTRIMPNSLPGGNPLIEPDSTHELQSIGAKLVATPRRAALLPNGPSVPEPRRSRRPPVQLPAVTRTESNLRRRAIGITPDTQLAIGPRAGTCVLESCSLCFFMKLCPFLVSKGAGKRASLPGLEPPPARTRIVFVDHCVTLSVAVEATSSSTASRPALLP
jgi:hypothetical protein